MYNRHVGTYITGSRGVRSSFGSGVGGSSKPTVDLLLRLWSRPRPRWRRRWFCSVEIDVTELRRWSALTEITELRRRIGDTRPELLTLVAPELTDWWCLGDSWGLKENSLFKSLYCVPASDLAREVPSRTTKSGVSRSSFLLSDKFSPGSRRCGTSKLWTGVDVRRLSSSSKTSMAYATVKTWGAIPNTDTQTFPCKVYFFDLRRNYEKIKTFSFW